MTDTQPLPTPEQQPRGRGEAASAEQTPSTGQPAADVESLRVTVDAQGNIVPEGDPAGSTVLTGQDAADALKKQGQAAKQEQQGAAPQAESEEQKASRQQTEDKARKAPPEDKGR